MGWLRNKKISTKVKVDIHSHLIPGLDDGVKSIEESLEILAAFEDLGYKKVITTPHVHSEYYQNTREVILDGLVEVRKELTNKGLTIEVEAAAEYYMDSDLLRLIETPDEILSFGKKKYVLVETPFMNKPLIFDEVVFQLKSNGFIPVLAHPERYTYLIADRSWLKNIKDKGVMLQITSGSMVGAYGKGALKIVRQLLKENMVDFIGSDIHRKSQLNLFQKSIKQKSIPQNLRNNELI